MGSSEETPESGRKTPLGDPLGLKGFLVILLGFVAAYHGDVLMGSHTFFFRDFGTFSYPNALYLRESLLSGRLPLWDPLNCCGIPFLAQWVTIGWYPPSLFLLMVPMPWAVGYFTLIHWMLAGVGMYLLAFAWTGQSSPGVFAGKHLPSRQMGAALAGIAYAFGGLTVNNLMVPHYMAAFAWIPWVVLTVERACREGGRRMVPAILTGTLQMLTGGPEVILMTWLILTALLASSLVRHPGDRIRAVTRFVIICAFISGLCAVQLLPFMDLLVHANRTTDFGQDSWPMPLWGWASFLVPLFHTQLTVNGVYLQESQAFTTSYYVGVGTLLFALSAVWRLRRLRVRLLGAIALAGTILALGSKGLVFDWVRAVFPPLGVARYPVKLLLLTTFAVPLLAAFGVGWWARAKPGTRGVPERVLFGFFILAIVAIAGVSWHWPVAGEDWQVTVPNAAGRALFLLLTVLAFQKWRSALAREESGLPGQPKQGRQWAVVLVLLTGIDLYTHLPLQNPTVITFAFEPGIIRREYTPEPGYRAMTAPVTRAILTTQGSSDALANCMGRRKSLYLNWNLVDGIPTVDGFFPLYPKHESELLSIIYKTTNAPSAGLADFLGASQTSSMESRYEWVSRPTALPLITGGQAPVYADDDTTIAALTGEDFDPVRNVYLPQGAENSFPVQPGARVEVMSQTLNPEEIRATVAATGPTVLVIAQTWYHNWKAEINGEARPLLRANHAFQAIPIPAGESEVRLVYQDNALRLGGCVTLLTMALLGTFAWNIHRRERTAGKDPNRGKV